MGLRWLVLVASLIVGPLLAEGILRFLLFHDGALAREWGARWRKPGRYGDPALDAEYWRLRWVFGTSARKPDPPCHDPLLGWTGREIEPGTYRLLEEPADDARRPLLVYGASFANCSTPSEDCFEGLLEHSDLAGELCASNYGVGGYGIDQVYLLLRETIDRYADRDPRVVIVAVADTDFERCSVDFRDWPKPRLRLGDGRLLDGDPVSPSPEAHLREHGTGVRSYVWSALLHGASPLPVGLRERLSGTRAKRREQALLIQAIVRSIREELDSRGIEWFLLLCVSPPGLRLKPYEPIEAMLLRFFEDERIPYVHMRPWILEWWRVPGRKGRDLFFQPGDQGTDHPTAEGNRLLFEAMRAGLEGRLSRTPLEALPDPPVWTMKD